MAKSEKPRSGSEPTPPHKIRQIILFVGVAILVVLIVQRFQAALSPILLTYSEFKRWLHEGYIQQVRIDDRTIFGQLNEKGRAAARRRQAERAADGAERKPGRVDARHFVTWIPSVGDSDLLKDLEAKGVSYEGTPLSEFRGLLPFIIVGTLFFVFFLLILRRMGPGEAAMSFAKSRAKMYVEKDTKITFGDVAGVDEAKAELEEIVEYLKTPEKFKRLGGRIPKGVLLVGPPGVGKTLLAKAVAGEAHVPFFSISGSDFVEMFVGVGASRVRDLFDQAEKHAPAIVFIDELDALGKVRGLGFTGAHDEREQTLNQLLVQMDGFDTNAGVIIMSATNRPEILDPALLRPGRFDRQVAIPPPDINGREAILKVHAKNVKFSPEVDLRKVAGRTPGFVGADLENVINEAALLAARRDKSAVEMDDLDEAIDRVVAGLEKKSRVMNDQEKKIIAYHEAGHAIVAESLPTTDPVHKVSVIPRGVAALGYTLQMPTEDRYLLTRTELHDRLTVLLGGRVAEEIIFGDVSTGAYNDLQQATDMARRMVTELGMSEDLGPLTFTHEARSPFLEAPWARRPTEYSETTAERIDAEVKRLVTESYERATEILQSHRELLDQVADLLLENEVVEGETLRAMMGKRGPTETGTHDETRSVQEPAPETR